jgi:hypothetical protein
MLPTESDLYCTESLQGPHSLYLQDFKAVPVNSFGIYFLDFPTPQQFAPAPLSEVITQTRTSLFPSKP